MRRAQFIELHEQPWFPLSLRHEITDALQFGLNLLKAYAPIAPLLQSSLDSTQCRSIVDMCSGGGGPWLDLSRRLQPDARVFRILLTDKCPNLGAFQNVHMASDNHIAFCSNSVDATKVPGDLPGYRTMFTSFHHFPPEEARAILQNAVDAGQSIGVFEITRRAPSAIALMFPWALMLFAFTPLIRPFRWSRLLYTYLIPIIPLVLLFDGIVSCLRTYRPQELRDIITKLSGIEYQWEVGEHSKASGGASARSVLRRLCEKLIDYSVCYAVQLPRIVFTSDLADPSAFLPPDDGAPIIKSLINAFILPGMVPY
jgi:hypothetical protein